MTAVDLELLAEQAAQIRRDLDELAVQVEVGEIDTETAERLRQTYREELASVESTIAEQADTGDTTEPGNEARSGRRMLVGAAIVIGALAVTLGIVGSFAQSRDDGPIEGVVDAGATDLDEISNETMEAAIASFRQDPDPAVAAQLPRMEFALAERYFEEESYQQAFDHYRVIIEDSNSTDDVVAPSLARVGWIVWVLNGEVDLALATLDRSLALAPDSAETLYVKGQVTWCGARDSAGAATLFERVLALPNLPDDVIDQVTTDLELAAAGAECG